MDSQERRSTHFMQDKLFFIEILFVGHGNDKFFPIQIFIFRMLRNMAAVRRYSLFRNWATCVESNKTRRLLHMCF